MTVEFERRAAFLAEMGVGPVWVRRAESQALVESEPAVSEPAVIEILTERAAPPAAAATEPTRASQVSRAAVAWDESPETSVVPVVPIVPIVPVVSPMPSRAVQIASDAAKIASMEWDELAQTVAACTRCGLCAGRTKTAFGVGDRKARWLFIGEGPGREEDLRGEPFVGRAGQLLDNMLASMQLARGQNAYIANIVKCRPTDENGRDRRPSAEESATCLPYLQRQIDLIQPTVIVALGKTAAVSLLGLDPETSVSGLRGRVHRYADRPLVVTYHPAYLLRTPEDKKKAWADLCLAMAEYAKAD